MVHLPPRWQCEVPLTDGIHHGTFEWDGSGCPKVQGLLQCSHHQQAGLKHMRGNYK